MGRHLTLVFSLSLVLSLGLGGCTNGRTEDLRPARSAAPLTALSYSRAAPPLPEPVRRTGPVGLTEPVLVKRVSPAPTFGGERRREPGTIALNFEKASLRSVIDAVLGDALGVPYAVDERVDGIVTLVSPQKLGREEALEVLDGVLRLNGATLIKGDTLYRIVLSANARQNLPSPRLGTEQPGFGLTVYVARHTAAVSLQRLIEPLYQIPGALAADADHNLLLISGSAEERRSLSDAARLFDQDGLANQSVGLFPLHHAKPKALAEELRAMLTPGSPSAAAPTSATPGPALSPSVRVTPIERLNAVMVVTFQPDQLDLAADWVGRLDQAGAGERRLHIYAVRYAKVQPLAKTLTRLFSAASAETGSSSLPPGTSGARLTSANAPAPPAGAAPSGTGTAAPQGQSGGFGSADHPLATDDAESESGESAGDSPNGPRIVPDIASHSLMILANEADFALIEEALGRLDARPAQIVIEATIAEVTLNNALEFGVQYFLRGKNLTDNQQGSLGLTSANAVGPLSQVAPGFNGVIGTLANPSVILSALNSVTDSRVLSAPQLLVADSREAVLKVGTQTPLLTQQLTSTLTGTSTVNSVDYHDTGVILRVLPRANDGGTVSLDIAQEVSEVVPTTTATLTPSITLRRIESSVTVQSGQTVMLGGLISETNSLTRNSVPGLGAIPLLGELFGNRNDSRARTELLVFITPHVLRDDDESDRLTRELVGRMRELRLPSDGSP